MRYYIQHHHLIFYVFFSIAIWSCDSKENSLLDYGISKELAQFRKAHIDNIHYDLHFNIPESRSESIEAQLTLSYNYITEVQDLILDFDLPKSNIRSVKLAGSNVDFEKVNNHLVIDKSLLSKNVKVDIEFIAGDQSLNRYDEYLYTLFVPARASTCFPLMDQPDLKAEYSLELRLPKPWKALFNESLVKEEIHSDSKTLTFGKTKKISSYLFAFAAGKFDVVERTIDERKMKMFHRETDSEKLNGNLEAIFDWHHKSLKWLETYTDIEYPFSKFDFILIPSFQYGGMEHPGAIFYKASSLLLDENSTINQKIGRGRLIAHETAHMWFGDLVTMPWFDDVWLKEVFANFMAAKIINPEFGDIDHNLNFLMANYPSAYSVDRTEGTHPIAQNLDNLHEAGSLYGSIIYQKAPIVMRMLEEKVGEEVFQQGIRRYLEENQFENASWDDLIKILSEVSNGNLKNWDRVWVKGKGMPRMMVRLKEKNNVLDNIRIIIINQDQLVNSQRLELEIGQDSLGLQKVLDIDLDERHYKIKTDSLFVPNYAFLNRDGKGYGYFMMGKQSINHYLNDINTIESSTTRAALWINLYEAVLRNDLSVLKFLDTLILSLSVEKEPLIVGYLNARLQTVFWKFLTKENRKLYAAKIEGLLFNKAISATSEGLRSSYFKAFYQLSTTEESTTLLKDIWSEKMELDQIKLSEQDKTNIAYQLALRLPHEYDQIVNSQLVAITNTDRKARFTYVSEALRPNENDRDSFFESLKDPVNRENEVWVLEALSYLHHPLRQDEAVKYITPTLELLEEIKNTGDIFFPKRWLDNTFAGHQSVEVADKVKAFLYRHHDYPSDLKNKILQSSDLLFRAEGILSVQKSELPNE